MATEYLIEPVMAPPGSEDYCLCDEQHATKWSITAWDNDRKPPFQARHGFYDSRELAEAHVTELIRSEVTAFIRVVGEELASAGFAPGDRTVILGHIRQLIAEHKQHRANRFIWRDGDVEHH